MKAMRIFSYGGIATVFILWFSIGLGMIRANLSFFDSRPLSYLGTDPNSNWLFSWGLILAAVATICFGYYLTIKYKAGRLFLAVLIFSQICQIITAIIPFSRTNSTGIIHTIAAFLFAITTVVFMYLFAKRQKGKLRQFSMVFASLEAVMFVIGIGGFILTTDAAPFFQSLVAITFHAWLIYLTTKTGVIDFLKQ